LAAPPSVRVPREPAPDAIDQRTDFERMTTVGGTFNEHHRYWQDHFDSRRIADRIDDLLVSDTIDAHAKRFIESRDMFFLATCDADGHPQCSYKGGDAGFVRVLDEHTLAFPVYDGNGMFLSLGNLRAQPHVGMLFVDFQQPNRLRLNGVASVDPQDPLQPTFPGATLVVRVRATHVFPNCGRYVHTMQLETHSPFVPRVDADAPIPDWKRMTWAQDYLPEDDPARDAEPIA
jgi:predicted pyridoxine 5'-phosphate oxidase superfamily flavin-nucleotide-binding protein